MGKVDESLLLSWSNLLSWNTLVLLLIAFALMVLVAKKPKLFWPMLIMVNIAGTGPRVKGYFFLDEILSWAIIFGVFTRATILGIHHAQSGRHSQRRLIFIIWVSYMIMESIAGMLVNEDLRIFRWVLFYFQLGLLSTILYNRNEEFPFPSFRQASLTVMYTTLIYNGIYLAQGVFFESILGEHWGRFLSQDMFWAGSAYATFPMLIATPAAVFLVNDRSLKVRIVAWSSIFVMMAVGLYFDCRTVWFVVGSFLIISLLLHRIRFQHVAAFLIMFLIIFVLFAPSPSEDIGVFVDNLIVSSQFLWNPGTSDVNRNLQFQAAFMTITENITTFFFGTGIYTHRVAIIPYIQELYRESLPPQDSLIPGSRDDTMGLTIFRTTGFTALLIDIGLIGMLLFMMNFVLTAHMVYRYKSSQMIFWTTLFLSFMWLFSSNIVDIILLYLLIMPRGFIEQWSRSSVVGKPSAIKGTN